MANSDSYQGKGTWEVRRHIKIPAMRHKADSLNVIALIDSLTGVCKAEVDLRHQRLHVRYDASQVDYQRVKAELEAAGYPAADDHWSRLKRYWYRFVDTNMRENSHARPPECCNKPPRRR